MAFDTKSPVPKVLFSPAGAVPDEDLDIIARQAKSPAAEAAIKLNVYQLDVESSTHTEEATPEVEPKKRETKATPSEEKDVADVIKKWSKK
jgi:hypothetical protein